VRVSYARHLRRGSLVAVRIRTSDGSAYVVDGSFAELQQQVIEALAADEPFIEVKNGSKEMRSINAHLIASLEEITDETLTPEQAQVLETAREAQLQQG
jgi:hypothetical protein